MIFKTRAPSVIGKQRDGKIRLSKYGPSLGSLIAPMLSPPSREPTKPMISVKFNPCRSQSSRTICERDNQRPMTELHLCQGLDEPRIVRTTTTTPRRSQRPQCGLTCAQTYLAGDF